MKRLPSGKVLDVLTLVDERIAFETGLAKSVVAPRLAAAASETQVWQYLRGWSNGYLVFSADADSGPAERTM